MRSCKILLVAVLFTLGFSSRAFSQASVNENLETAFIYVDQYNGNDSNPGTVTQPLKTIGASVTMAENNNANGIGSRVTIDPGIYREAVTVAPPFYQTSLPITFEAARTGTAIVSGSQVFAGWQTYPANNNIYTNAWPYAWGLCNTGLAGAPPVPDVVMRREMVFVNGMPLTEVLSLNEVTVGTFYVNESNGTIYMWPPTGANMFSATIEVAVQPTLMNIQGQSNLVVRGLTFQYANTCREFGAVSVTANSLASNILFDDDNFFWNNAQGLSINPALTDFTVQNSVANHNGEAGFQGTQVTYGLYQNDVASFNNWRGAQGAYYTWNSGGAHFYQMHQVALQNFTSSYNETYGTHFDTDNANFTVNSSTFYGNLVPQLLIEKSEGPGTISGSTLCSGIPATYGSNVALGIRNSEFVTVTSSNLINTGQGIGVVGTVAPMQVTNWQTLQAYSLQTQNLTLSQDIIEGGVNQNLFADSLGTTAWSAFESTFSSNYNNWWNGSSSTPFTIPSGSGTMQLNFAGWQSNTGQDTLSTFSVPLGNPAQACSAQPDIVDYWFTVPVTSGNGIYSGAGSATVAPGGSAPFVATMVPLGFKSTVSAQLSFDGVQNIPGASASWSSGSILPNQNATFTVNTSATTPAGTYQITLIAQSGNLTKTLVILLTVS